MTYTGGKPVWGCGLVDVVMVTVRVGAVGGGLAFAPPHRSAVHHASADLHGGVLGW